MAVLPIVLWMAGGALIVATGLSLLRGEAWWIRIWDFPRVQVAALLATNSAASVFTLDLAPVGNLAFLAVLLLALGYQLFRIFPYTPLAPTQVIRARSADPANRIRLLTANVLMTNRRADDFLRIVRETDPDIVLALETDSWWDSKLAALDADYPHAVKHPREDTYGMHLFSKLELRDATLRFLIDDDTPSIRASVRLRGGAWIDVYGAHPPPPRPAQDTDERDAELLLIGQEAKRSRRPSIVAGDMNDVAWSHTTRLFQRTSGMLDPRVGRGAFSTFPARYPGLRWALDHVFHDSSFSLVALKRLGYFGSDHLPILVELHHAPGARPFQEAPEGDHGDYQEAAEKIEEGRVRDD